MKKKIFLLCFGLLALCVITQAQVAGDFPGKQAALHLFTRLQESSYRQAISFDVKYTYANESRPDILLDSLEGNMQQSGSYFRCVLGATETFGNNRYNVAAFTEDQLLYIAAATPDSLRPSPLSYISQALQQSGIQQCVMTQQKALKTARFTFPDNQSFKFMEMTVDTTTWQLQRIIMTVKTEMLVSNGMRPGAGYDDYALVIMTFMHYTPLTAEQRRFDEQAYFNKVGKEFKPAGRFAGYQVYIGSPQLQ
ncbi:hypothetical protein [Chitinophaga nivalis]|uniref:Uncharacterized protein n=1 Tax=Chitinophaga nivalis TaxID=2991709 RepID=A0ABT3IRP2_9BACT|nr:hypothetical protein [Chitinophaga nivalis]MCW3463665.1 hypothetical protein [Chitinophaga nivalis]MCW3486645.1 hypothetical protein [Chitinophaga nivalis]